MTWLCVDGAEESAWRRIHMMKQTVCFYIHMFLALFDSICQTFRYHPKAMMKKSKTLLSLLTSPTVTLPLTSKYSIRHLLRFLYCPRFLNRNEVFPYLSLSLPRQHSSVQLRDRLEPKKARRDLLLLSLPLKSPPRLGRPNTFFKPIRLVTPRMTRQLQQPAT